MLNQRRNTLKGIGRNEKSHVISSVTLFTFSFLCAVRMANRLKKRLHEISFKPECYLLVIQLLSKTNNISFYGLRNSLPGFSIFSCHPCNRYSATLRRKDCRSLSKTDLCCTILSFLVLLWWRIKTYPLWSRTKHLEQFALSHNGGRPVQVKVQDVYLRETSRNCPRSFRTVVLSTSILDSTFSPI